MGRREGVLGELANLAQLVRDESWLRNTTTAVRTMLRESQFDPMDTLESLYMRNQHVHNALACISLAKQAIH